MQISLFDQVPTLAPAPVPAPPPTPIFTRADFEAAYDVYTLYQRGDLHYFRHADLFEYAVEAGWLTICTSIPEKNIYLYERKS